MSRSWAKILGVALIALVVTLVFTACGGGSEPSPSASAPTETTPATSPSTGVSESPSPSGSADAIQAYVQQVMPIAQEVMGTIGTVPGIMQGAMGKQNGGQGNNQQGGQQSGDWNTAAKELQKAADKLGTQIKSFAALTPPASIASVQAEFVKALEQLRGQIEKTATALKNQDSKWTMQRHKVMAQISALQAKISKLSSEIGALMGGGGASPSPTQ